jgi:hypothetical protein
MNEQIADDSRQPFALCQQKLATIWFVGSGFIVLLVVAESLGHIYGTSVKEAWSWLVPNIIPTLTLMIGVLATGTKNQAMQATAAKIAYRLSAGISVFYLLLVVVAIVLWPATKMKPLDLMNLSTLWLNPVQGLVGISIGGFFGSRKR